MKLNFSITFVFMSLLMIAWIVAILDSMEWSIVQMH